MGRAERRRNAKNERKEKKATYNLTREQLNHMVHERVEDELDHMRQEAMEGAINTAMPSVRSAFESCNGPLLEQILHQTDARIY